MHRRIVNDARSNAQTNVLDERNRVITQRNVEELDAAKHRLAPRLEAVRGLARLPIEVLPRLLEARDTLRVAHVHTQREGTGHRRIHQRDDERIHCVVTPVETSLASATNQVDSTLEARGLPGLRRQLTTVNTHGGHGLFVTRAVEALDTSPQFNSHPCDGLHRAAIELFVRLTGLETGRHLALQLLELLGRHAVISHPELHTIKSALQGDARIRPIGRRPRGEGNGPLLVVTRTAHRSQVGTIVRRGAICARDDVIHFRRRERNFSAAVEALVVLPLQREVADLVGTTHLTGELQLCRHLGDGRSVRAAPPIVFAHELTGNTLRSQAVTRVLDVDDRRLAPALRRRMQPSAHLLQHAIDGRVTRRRTDRLHCRLPVVSDIKFQATRSVEIYAVTQHPLRQATKAIQRVCRSSLGK
ncbi:Uncharacterised protein [Mycobacteroides abscessus subsp. abscessus]|nr:Uncharacterised protein [Mycobacteroides abscessus subsp. abscessus]